MCGKKVTRTASVQDICVHQRSKTTASVQVIVCCANLLVCRRLVKMVLTKAQSKIAFTRVLNENLQLDETKSLMKALVVMEIENIVDLMCLTDEDIEAMSYIETIEGKETEKKVSFKVKKLLKQLLQWADYNATRKADQQANWKKFNENTLDEFKEVSAMTISGRSKGMKSEPSLLISKIDRFKPKVKMDVQQFAVFDGSLEKCLTWKRITIAQLVTYGMLAVTETSLPSHLLGLPKEALFNKQNLNF